MVALARWKPWGKPKEKTLSFKHEHFLNAMPLERLREIIVFSESDHHSKIWPEFLGKKIVYFNDQKHPYLYRKLLAHAPEYMVNYVYQGQVGGEQNAQAFTVMGDLHRLSLRRGHYDLMIAPMALESDETTDAFLKAISATMSNGSRLSISFVHPHLSSFLLNQNPMTSQTVEKNVSQIYNLLKKYNLYTEDMQEGLVDLPLKAFFADGFTDYYHEYKNLPVTLLFKLVKYQRSKT